MRNNRVAVIGYGNVLRGDDGIGIVAVRQIKNCIKGLNPPPLAGEGFNYLSLFLGQVIIN